VPAAFERLCVRDLSHETGALRKVERANLLPSENPRVNLRRYEDELSLAKLNAGDTHTFKTICGQYLKVRERQHDSQAGLPLSVGTHRQHPLLPPGMRSKTV